MRTLYKTLTAETQLFDIVTTSFRSSVGGHIHFEKTGELATDNKLIEKTMLLLRSFYLPLLLGENVLSNRKRCANYGKVTDYRISEKTIEYRAPSAEWTTTPRLATATLAFFGVVYHEITKDIKEFEKKYKNLIIKETDAILAIQNLLLSKNSRLVKNILGTIKKNICKFELYPEWKEEINFVLSPTKVLKEKEKVNYNIAEGWNLVERISNSKILLNNKKLEERIKTIDIEK
jgi:hypothetical protein